MKDKTIIESIQVNEEKKSTSSVLNLSLDSTKGISKDRISAEYNSDFKNELIDEVILPIENEIESSDYIIDEKEKELDLEKIIVSKSNLLNNEDNFQKKLKTRKRSKSFGDKKNIKKYCHIRKEPEEYISPLKLCRKTFGNISKWNKKPNEVLCDFQKNIVDCKSCNDDDSQDDLFLFYSDTERVTPNPEDLQNLLNCRKKMALFKNCINDRTVKEYENILNSENIFINKKFLDNHQIKKSNFWHKHIRQILRDNNNNKNHNSFLTRLSAGSIVNKCDKNNNKEDGLFILGILESAVNGRKGRYTTNA